MLRMSCTWLIMCWMLQMVAARICREAVCTYEFVVRWQRSMTYTKNNVTYNVRLNGTDFKIEGNNFREATEYPLVDTVVPWRDVITTDGFPRDVITINGEFPGPNIEVVAGVKVEVRVINKLWTEGVTIHWHGLYMQDNLWMDGVPFLTQCPIPPGQSFVYRFTADPVGTHWYHSHFHSQRLDGLNGLLVVHPRIPADFQQPREHLVNLMDWLHVDGTTLRVLNPYDRASPGTGELYTSTKIRHYSSDLAETSSMRYVSGLVNGRGRMNENELHPLEEFVVRENTVERFRMIHSGSEYTLEVSIDGHRLIVVASDGWDIEPIIVDSLIIFPGETMDFTVETTQKPSKYWFRAKTLAVGESVDIPQDIKAIVTYSSAKFNPDHPSSLPRQCIRDDPCKVFSCPFPSYPTGANKLCVGYGDMHMAENKYDRRRDRYGLTDDDVEEFFLNVAFSYGSSIRGRQFVAPTQPVYQDFPNSIVPCNDIDCENGCACTNIEQITLGKTVQIVLSALQTFPPSVAHHSMHLHGYSFAVVGVGYPELNATTGRWVRANDDIVCNNQHCSKSSWNRAKTKPKLNLDNPLIKDTVVIPARGYVVIRFKADNPGLWLFHCHQELHNLEGMTMALSAGDITSYPPVPQKFPTCLPYENDATEIAPAVEDSSSSLCLVVAFLVGVLTGTIIVPVAMMVARKYQNTQHGKNGRTVYCRVAQEESAVDRVDFKHLKKTRTKALRDREIHMTCRQYDSDDDFLSPNSVGVRLRTRTF